MFRYYGGQDEHQQEAVLRHEVEGKSGEVGLQAIHTAVLESEQLEGGQHSHAANPLLGALVPGLIRVV